jgi:long-chain acyl-CoA synthetase
VISYWAQRRPDGPAIVSDAGSRSWAELDARANQLARALRARGAGPDAGVVLLCGNRPEFVEVWAATQRAGIRLTTVNWHLTGEEGRGAGTPLVGARRSGR